MASFGCANTRALAAVSTGDMCLEETPLPGAILTRVASSHIRVGTFQFFAARRDTQNHKTKLTGHVIERHYPELLEADNPPLALLTAALKQQVKLIAHWQSIGFIHGVMNTDNASVAGLTIDYGPCAFMDTYHPETVFSSIDHGSRYTYQNQPGIAQWNMANLAQCLLSLIDGDEEKSLQAAQDVIDSFPSLFEAQYLTHFRHKIGLSSEQETDGKLIADLLSLMQEAKADFTNTFRTLSLHAIFENTDATQWLQRWNKRMEGEPNSIAERVELMQSNNPAYIPRNHRIEEIIVSANEQDYEPMQRLMGVLQNPFNEQPGMETYAQAPTQSEVVQATFCGT
ncbi:UNVERIFIED_CONTAM: hypothetical protein GTU68_036052 [Idotea baltica]|nr:hypothetical protein [Idotea baltica]